MNSKVYLHEVLFEGVGEVEEDISTEGYSHVQRDLPHHQEDGNYNLTEY